MKSEIQYIKLQNGMTFEVFKKGSSYIMGYYVTKGNFDFIKTFSILTKTYSTTMGSTQSAPNNL
jgi:hypothetical protein